MEQVTRFLGSITSRCSGKWARTQQRPDSRERQKSSLLVFAMDKIWAKLQKSLVQKDIKELFEVNKVRRTLINIFSIYRIFKKRLWFNHHNGWPAGKSHSLFSKCFRSITERFIVYSLQLGIGACLVWQKTKINHERCRILRTLASLRRCAPAPWVGGCTNAGARKF